MSMRASKTAAVEFLEWQFGKDPAPHFIGISYQRDIDTGNLDDAPQDTDDDDFNEANGPPKSKRKGNREVKQFVYSVPNKVGMSQWESESEDNHIYFCTSPLATKRRILRASNIASVPSLWFDIDALRNLDIDGDEFLADLRTQEEFSCLARTSAQGIQGYFKLNEAYNLANEEQETDAEDASRKKDRNKLFDTEILPLLWNICYYMGGDPQVCSPARLMRLPGSLNIKRDNYLCRAQYLDHTFTMAELRKRFTVDEHLVPKIIFYAIVKAMEKVYGEGAHHEPSLRLFGTCRLIGIDRESCARLAVDLRKFFKDIRDDLLPDVKSTYDRDIEDEGLASLRNDYEEIADEVERAIKLWVELKKKYCKSLGIPWSPEQNPLSSNTDSDELFQIRPEGTYFVNRNDVSELFANFSINITHKIIKIDRRELAVADLIFQNRKYTFEWDCEKSSTFAQFSKIHQLPWGIMVMVETMWKQYVQWLASRPVVAYLHEAPFYGVMDVEQGAPTVVLPGQSHPTYYYSESPHDTADRHIAFKKIGKKVASDYLTTLAAIYPTLQNASFVWPALGWFVACPFAAFIRLEHDGFPILMVSGLHESGKSFVVEKILGRHMGCLTAQTFTDTTQASRRKQLSSNNLIPLVVGEFRDDDVIKSRMFQDLIRALWEAKTRLALTKEGGSAINNLVGTMCVVGEHLYQDQAALNRTVSIRVNRDFLDKLFSLPEEEHNARLAQHEQLQSSRYHGILGSIVIQWMQDNFERIPELLHKAETIIYSRCNRRNIRNTAGLSVVVFGLFVMNEIYKYYGLNFPLDKATMIEAIFSADEEVNSNITYGAVNLKTLFMATDAGIVEEARVRGTLQHSLYEFDPENEDLVYFDTNRWYSYISRWLRGSISATLTNRAAFIDLLHVSMKNTESPILEFPEDHPIFKSACVKLSMGRIQENYNINVQQWRTLIQDYT